jgi:hypothetical protein
VIVVTAQTSAGIQDDGCESHAPAFVVMIAEREADMFAIRLVQLIEAHSDELSKGLMRRLETAPQCAELLRKVPSDELERRAHEIYRNLSDWLLTKTESEIEERYIGLGVRRARQGVPFSQFLWAVTLTKEYLWEHLEKEGLLEEPVELLGEIELVHNLERFFERATYFAAVGYESAARGEAARTPGIPAGARR